MDADRWAGLELRHLLALDAVAREGSFGRAAISLGYTQSAISQQIAALERIVGERLLERPGGQRPVGTTEAGALLLRHADAIVARLAAARADLQALSGGEAGTLRIGIFQSVGERILPDVVRSFSESWPKVELALTESASDEELLALVERGELDLAFADLPLTEGPFDHVELYRDPFVLVVPADSPLADRTAAPSASEIAELDLIGFRSCRTEQQVEAALRRPLRYVFRADQNGTVQGVVGAGVGVALVPRMTVDTTDPRTVVLDLGSKVPPRVIALAWHRDRYRAPAARAFVECAQAVCARLESEPVAV